MTRLRASLQPRCPRLEDIGAAPLPEACFHQQHTAGSSSSSSSSSSGQSGMLPSLEHRVVHSVGPAPAAALLDVGFLCLGTCLRAAIQQALTGVPRLGPGVPLLGSSFWLKRWTASPATALRVPELRNKAGMPDGNAGSSRQAIAKTAAAAAAAAGNRQHQRQCRRCGVAKEEADCGVAAPTGGGDGGGGRGLYLGLTLDMHMQDDASHIIAQLNDLAAKVQSRLLEDTSGGISGPSGSSSGFSRLSSCRPRPAQEVVTCILEPWGVRLGAHGQRRGAGRVA
uniref:Uncharacterized protein n=1 Tax=Tetradesmus obliquus TaxID=3088 RepID=A0A383VQA6_TETOB|eukprot:jgi/Sobl393_1/691/SZX67371.1